MEDELDWNEKVCREIMYNDDEDEFIWLHIIYNSSYNTKMINKECNTAIL